MSGILQVIGAVIATAVLTGCAAGIPQESRLSGPSTTDLTYMIGAPGAPQIVARNADTVAAAARTAARYATERLPTARGLRRLQISEIPYLRRSTEGAAFLSQPLPRALARGAPAEMCPAAAASPAGVETTASAVSGAMNACFARLRARGAATSCGCQILAVDNALVAPRQSFIFAPGVTAFLIRDDKTPIERIVAESEPAPNGVETVLLRSAASIVGALVLSEESAEMRLADQPDVLWTGARRPFGYRRGRLAERIEFQSGGGGSIRLLIGVETRDAVAAR